MNLKKFNNYLKEERISGVRASWTSREIKNTLKSILNMDIYKNLNDYNIIKVFMKKFDRFIKKNNLNKNEIRNLAKMELKKIRERSSL